MCSMLSLTPQAASMAEILSQIEKIPHDPVDLGVAQASLRRQAFPAPFQRQALQSLDGTPLVGAMAIHPDGQPRPGVILAHGITGSKNHKPLVDLSTVLYHNGWHVFALDLRGHGESRDLSPACITRGWKEADDILAGAQVLREASQARSVAVLGFSMGGRSAVKAMIKDGGHLLHTGMVCGAPLGEFVLLPPDPKVPLPPTERALLTYLGASSLYEYFERAASAYGVTREFLVAEHRVHTALSQITAPLLLISAFDDHFWLERLHQGRHDGGDFSLQYRDAVQGHPHVGTLAVDRGGHAARLYLSDPHWFSTLALTYLKYWQAPQAAYVTVQVPTAELRLEGKMAAESAVYRVLVRNHGQAPLTNVTLSIALPAETQILDCWAGVEGCNPCRIEGTRLTWTIPRLSGGKSTAGPFVFVISTAALKPGKVDVKTWLDVPGTFAQEVTLEKP